MVLHFDMDCIPDEIIGDMLSRLLDPRDVVVASATCKKWRRAMQFHLKSLTFDANVEFREYFQEIHKVEPAMSQIILQTKSLESLSIRNEVDYFTGAYVEFSEAVMRSWLVHTKDTLRELILYAKVHLEYNIFEKCQWNKLEVLELRYLSFTGVKLSDMPVFPCLKKLRFSEVKLSALQLSNFVALCPKVENLGLMYMDVGPGANLEWLVNTLKNIEVIAMSFERFVLKADNLESLYFLRCYLQHFKLVGNEALKGLNIRDSRISNFDVGDQNFKNLDYVYVNESKATGLMLYRMISESSNLRRLQLWPETYDDCYGFTNLEMISASFPRLTLLSLIYTEQVDLCLNESFLLQNLVELELGFASYYSFKFDRIEGFIERCPKLKKMVVHMFNCEGDYGVWWDSLGRFSSSILHLGRKYLHVEFELKYHEAGI